MSRLLPRPVVLLPAVLVAALSVSAADRSPDSPAAPNPLAGFAAAPDDLPRLTHTKKGLPGDPLNLALVGSEADLQRAMLAAGWHPADALTFRSCLKITVATLLRRPYEDAPVSNLFVWGRKQDLAFEQPVGHDPRRRHHVRFWRSEQPDGGGRPLWLGAATFDTSVGLSHTTGGITHHIAAAVDEERDKLIRDLTAAGWTGTVSWVNGYQPHLQGRNGGGDPYFTDGRLGVVVLAGPQTPGSR
jgi:hypothetical protein